MRHKPSWLAKRAAQRAAGPPSDAAEGWRKRPAGWPTGRRPVRCRAMEGPSANPRNPAANPKGASVGVPFLLVRFFWASKENELAPRRGAKPLPLTRAKQEPRLMPGLLLIGIDEPAPGFASAQASLVAAAGCFSAWRRSTRSFRRSMLAIDSRCA